VADKRPTKTKLPETKIDLELPTSKGELVPYKKPEGGLSDTPQGKRATRKIAKSRGSAKRRALSALLELLIGAAVDTEPLPGPEIDRRTVLRGIGHGLTSLVTPDIPFKLGTTPTPTPTPKPELLELGIEVLGKQLGSDRMLGIPSWMHKIKDNVNWMEFRDDLNDRQRQFQGTATGQKPDMGQYEYLDVEGPEWGKEVIKTILGPERSDIYPPEGKKGLQLRKDFPDTPTSNRYEQRKAINSTLKEVVDTIYSPHTPKKIMDRMRNNSFGAEILNKKEQGVSQKEIYELLSKNNPSFNKNLNWHESVSLIKTEPHSVLDEVKFKRIKGSTQIPFKGSKTKQGKVLSEPFIPTKALEFIGLRNIHETRNIVEDVTSSISFEPKTWDDYYAQSKFTQAEQALIGVSPDLDSYNKGVILEKFGLDERGHPIDPETGERIPQLFDDKETLREKHKQMEDFRKIHKNIPGAYKK